MKNKIFNAIFTFAILAALVIFLAGVAVFLQVNSSLIGYFPLIVTVVCLIFATSIVCGILFYKKEANKCVKISAFILIGVTLIAMILIILFCMVIDFFQPLTLTTIGNGLIFAGLGITVGASVLYIIFTKKYILPMVACVCVCCCLITGVIWANAQPYQKFSEKVTVKELFVNGEGGYATFRIPSLLSLDKDVLNKSNERIYTEDVLVAMAEARKDGSQDIGEIDLVYKLSFDSGKTWSDLKILIDIDEKGKVGNPTIGFDKNTAKLVMLYLVGTEKSGYNYLTYAIRGEFNHKDGFNFDEPTLITKEYDENAGTGKHDGVTQYTIMAGPGKIVQTKSGRLVAPCSNAGFSYAAYSDDGGYTWIRGESEIAGNECEIAILNDSTLVMVSRDNVNCAGVHNEQYVRLAYSYDNGQSWQDLTECKNLKTPICMSSIVRLNENKIALTFPDDFYMRTDLTIAISSDGGKTFSKEKLYDGASGYSCVETNGEGKIFVIAEIGKVNYNETISFFEYVG